MVCCRDDDEVVCVMFCYGRGEEGGGGRGEGVRDFVTMTNRITHTI